MTEHRGLDTGYWLPALDGDARARAIFDRHYSRRTFPSSVISAPCAKRHSQKPDVFTDFIEQVGHPPYLEMFARRKRLGWDVYGNEVSTSALVYETLTPSQSVGLTAEQPA